MDKYLDNCESCYFNFDGECRLNPPVLLAVESSTDYHLEDGHKVWETEHSPAWGFPAVAFDDWCGQWQQDERR